MNSIIALPIVASWQDLPIFESALQDLGVWLDTEMEPLEELFSISDRNNTEENVLTLLSLHLNSACRPEDFRKLIGDALASLERFEKLMHSISVADFVDAGGSSEFEARVRWSGARLEDVVNTLRRALQT